MEAGQQQYGPPVWRLDGRLDPMTEPWSRRLYPPTEPSHAAQHGVEAVRPQRDEAANRRQHQRQLGSQPRLASVSLDGDWPIVRRCASDGGDDPGVDQPLSVAGMLASADRRQADPMHRTVEPLARPVAGE